MTVWTMQKQQQLQLIVRSTVTTTAVEAMTSAATTTNKAATTPNKEATTSTITRVTT